MCSLARSFAARICDIFHKLVLTFSLSLHPHPFIFRDMRLEPNVLELALKFGISLHLHPFYLGICWLKFGTFHHFSAISEGSGDTGLKCSLAGSFAAPLYDIFHELALKIGPEPPSKSLFLGIRFSHMRLVSNFLELAYEIWPRPSSTSLLFSVICKGSGETAQMCCLA